MMISKYFSPFIAVLIYISPVYSEYTRIGTIESLREDGNATVIFTSNPDRELYYILTNEKIIGNIHSLKQMPDVYGKKRFRCSYSLLNDEYIKILRAGLDIVIIDKDKEIDKRPSESSLTYSSLYKTEIVSLIDKREMVLIPEGKFILGCSICSEDEFPEHQVFTGNYYIDKFEVSNIEYKKYADNKGITYPEYWEGQLDHNNNFISVFFSSLPVIVTYYEASGYASWAGKRLPTEQEWEKASRKPESMDSGDKSSLYSWGSGFIEGIANTEELWLSEKNGENLKRMITEKYGLTGFVKGYIPVDIYEKSSLSYFGVAHLDGNALEWTDSWYKPYPGNTKSNKKYGNQYKVIRGGSFFSSKTDSRITDRKVGGIPDLYRDRIAGFRCVKNTTGRDKK